MDLHEFQASAIVDGEAVLIFIKPWPVKVDGNEKPTIFNVIIDSVLVGIISKGATGWQMNGDGNQAVIDAVGKILEDKYGL